MKFLAVIIIIAGGFLFIYFNTKFSLKINLTSFYANINFNIIIFNRSIIIIKKIDYACVAEKLIFRKKNIEYKKYFDNFNHYKKYFKYVFKIFIIKNFIFYNEIFDDKASLVIELDIVNRIL